MFILLICDNDILGIPTYSGMLQCVWKWKWSHSVLSNSLWPHGLWPTSLLRPWNFLGKSTGVGCHFLLQMIFPTQGSNPGILYYRQLLYHLSHQGSPVSKRQGTNIKEEGNAEEQRVWKEQNDEHCLKAETCFSVRTEEM